MYRTILEHRSSEYIGFERMRFLSAHLAGPFRDGKCPTESIRHDVLATELLSRSAVIQNPALAEAIRFISTSPEDLPLAFPEERPRASPPEPLCHRVSRGQFALISLLWTPYRDDESLPIRRTLN